MEERDDVIVLVDENGEEVEFEYMDTIELNGKEYVVLLPAEEEEQDDESENTDEVVILAIEHNESGEDNFVTVEDEKVLDEVFEEFKKRLEMEYEYEET